MIIKSAEFITSAVKPSQYPLPDLPEVAFAGRSNVGKSSLINTLVNRRHLVKTSSTPGRTQLINFFAINQAFRFVDLPGYGYARVPSNVQRQWGPMVDTYISTREVLKAVVLILDLRRTPAAQDIELIGFLRYHRLPICLVLTKADKLTRNHQHQQHMNAARAVSLSPEQLFVFSAKTRQGLEPLWHTINALLHPENPNEQPLA